MGGQKSILPPKGFWDLSRYGVYIIVQPSLKRPVSLIQRMKRRDEAAGEPSPLTVFSTVISRNIGKAPYIRQIGSCLTEFLQVWSYFRRVSLTRNESQKGHEWRGSCRGGRAWIKSSKPVYTMILPPCVLSRATHTHTPRSTSGARASSLTFKTMSCTNPPAQQRSPPMAWQTRNYPLPWPASALTHAKNATAAWNLPIPSSKILR